MQLLPLRLRDQLSLTTTVGYGPRFLHFTGHLHKSDANNALFTQFTVDLLRHLRNPEEAGRHFIPYHLGADTAGG